MNIRVTKIVKAYKVVAYIDNKLYSMYVNKYTSPVLQEINKLCIEYKLNEWVESNDPFNYKWLFAYATMPYQFTLFNPFVKTKLFECEVYNPIFVNSLLTNFLSIDEYKESINKIITDVNVENNNYILCEKIKLLKEINV